MGLSVIFIYLHLLIFLLKKFDLFLVDHVDKGNLEIFHKINKLYQINCKALDFN